MTKQNGKYQIILMHVSWEKPDEKLYVTQYYIKFESIGKKEVESFQIRKTLTTYNASWQSKMPNIKSFWRM